MPFLAAAAPAIGAVGSVVSAGAAVAGIGLQYAGMKKQEKAAKAHAEASRNIAVQEQQADLVRRQAMELDARRRQREMVRQHQRVRAMNLVSATSQGAFFGSGLQGGYGQAGGQTGVNLLGVTQNLELGRQLFDLNANISNYRFQQAQSDSDAAEGRGLSGLGGSLLGASSYIGPLLGGFGGGKALTGGVQTPYFDTYGNAIGMMGRGPIY